MREVLTYSRRGSRFTPSSSRPGTPTTTPGGSRTRRSTYPGCSFAGWFDRDQPLVVEIGSGIGEATVALAAERPGQRPGLRGLASRRGHGRPGAGPGLTTCGCAASTRSGASST